MHQRAIEAEDRRALRRECLDEVHNAAPSDAVGAGASIDAENGIRRSRHIIVCRVEQDLQRGFRRDVGEQVEHQRKGAGDCGRGERRAVGKPVVAIIVGVVAASRHCNRTGRSAWVAKVIVNAGDHDPGAGRQKVEGGGGTGAVGEGGHVAIGVDSTHGDDTAVDGRIASHDRGLRGDCALGRVGPGGRCALVSSCKREQHALVGCGNDGVAQVGRDRTIAAKRHVDDLGAVGDGVVDGLDQAGIVEAAAFILAGFLAAACPVGADGQHLCLVGNAVHADIVLPRDNDAGDHGAVAIGVDVGGQAGCRADVMGAGKLAREFRDRRIDVGVDDRDDDALPGCALRIRARGANQFGDSRRVR